MNSVVVTIATLALASSLSYASLTAGDNISSFRQPPPPAPPVEATIDSEETVTGVEADGGWTCDGCRR